MNKINVAVFFGGESLENEVSKITGAQIIHALNKNKYKIFPIYIDDLFNWWHLPNYPLNNNVNTTKKIKINISSGENNFYFNNLCKSKIRIDCAILAVHGGKGENGHLSGILNSLNIPHTASCSLSSGLTMNKHLTKIILKENKMNCLPYEVINKKEFRRFSKKEFEHYLIEENSETKFDWSECVDIDILRLVIRDIPAADVTPVVQGEWKLTGYGDEWECSNCKSQIALSDDKAGHPHYCPNSGAYMIKDN